MKKSSVFSILAILTKYQRRSLASMLKISFPYIKRVKNRRGTNEQNLTNPPSVHATLKVVNLRRYRFELRCGTKRYIAEIEINGEKQTKPIIARTPAEARKSIRKTYGRDTDRKSVV